MAASNGMMGAAGSSGRSLQNVHDAQSVGTAGETGNSPSNYEFASEAAAARLGLPSSNKATAEVNRQSDAGPLFVERRRQ